MYGKHPLSAPTYRKQHGRRNTWRTKAEAFDPNRVSRTLSPKVAI